MLSLLKGRLQNHFEKYESKLTLDQWMEKMKLKVSLLNGEDEFAPQLQG